MTWRRYYSSAKLFHKPVYFTIKITKRLSFTSVLLSQSVFNQNSTQGFMHVAPRGGTAGGSGGLTSCWRRLQSEEWSWSGGERLRKSRMKTRSFPLISAPYEMERGGKSPCIRKGKINYGGTEKGERFLCVRRKLAVHGCGLIFSLLKWVRADMRGDNGCLIH